MSNTRKAETGAPFRQERYASSAQIERGLMANLVAVRCETFEHPNDRELIYFLQLLSHREGGLKKVVADLLAMAPENIGTPAMIKFGTKGKIYSADKVRAIRAEMPIPAFTFRLRGEQYSNRPNDLSFDQPDYAEDRLEAAAKPDSYPVSDFVDFCRSGASHMETDLKELCLDPAFTLSGNPGCGATQFSLWYFQNIVETLRRYQANWIEQQNAEVVVTELGQKVYDTLDFTLEARCLTLIDGFARTGKTFAAKAWCDAHPGRARYVQVPSTNDEIGFFRAIAKSLGVSINLNSKAQELRQRIEEVLQRGHLAIVFDEAHWIWPNTNLRDAVPTRLTWIMTALVNYGVPVSLVTTPQFLRTQKAIERKSNWTSEQFIGRIGHYEKLPDSLAESDLSKVAASLLPEGDSRTLEILVRYAQGSAKYLAGIEIIVRRARYLAGKDGRSEVSKSDIKRAVQDSVIPSDSALTNAIAEPEKKSRPRTGSRLPTHSNLVAESSETGGEESAKQFTYRNTTVSPVTARARSSDALVPA